MKVLDFLLENWYFKSDASPGKIHVFGKKSQPCSYIFAIFFRFLARLCLCPSYAIPRKWFILQYACIFYILYDKIVVSDQNKSQSQVSSSWNRNPYCLHTFLTTLYLHCNVHKMRLHLTGSCSPSSKSIPDGFFKPEPALLPLTEVDLTTFLPFFFFCGLFNLPEVSIAQLLYVPVVGSLFVWS